MIGNSVARIPELFLTGRHFENLNNLTEINISEVLPIKVTRLDDSKSKVQHLQLVPDTASLIIIIIIFFTQD